MTATEKYLLLLRKSIVPEKQGSLWYAPAGSEQEIEVEPADLPEIAQLCRRHATEPLIYNELLKIPDLLAREQRQQMKQVCVHYMMQQAEWERLIAKVWQSLDGMYAVLMKGFSYAQRYPSPYLRSWGDLDVWVGPAQYHKACGLLRDAFPDAKHHDEEWDELKHYCFVFPNGMAIELHRVSMDFTRPQDQAYWNHLTDRMAANPDPENKIQVGQVLVPIFEAKFDLLFCFLHSWEHFTSTGIPLKQVADMVLLMDKALSTETREALDAYLHEHLKALRMLEVWRYYGYMACKMFGIPMSAWPLVQERGTASAGQDVVLHGERLYRRVLEEGECRAKDYGESKDRYEAREKARKMNVLSRKWLTLRGRLSKAKQMYYFAPRYACYALWQQVLKGIRRTIRREKMIDY